MVCSWGSILDSALAQDTPPGVPNKRDATGNSVRGPSTVTVAQLTEFDEIIDVRSEAEFAQDHVPDALNCPVLNNAERARVGTVYKQVSAFEAKKIGAALVSANISRHIEAHFFDRSRSWRPLLYCWRGGERSGAFAHVLAQVGWQVGRLDGGYRAYRRAVVAGLSELPRNFSWRVVCGLTGTGKSRLLRALHEAGCQVLDLEALAAHRGSVLGDLPDEAQPPQKLFESRIWSTLRGFDAARAVYVEAESRKVGNLRVPEALIESMWTSDCVVVEAPVPVRVALLKEEYRHFLDQPENLIVRLECLAPLHGHAVMERWRDLALARRWDELITDLLVKHYDPAYSRAVTRHYPMLPRALKLDARSADECEFGVLARRCIEAEKQARTSP